MPNTNDLQFISCKAIPDNDPGSRHPRFPQISVVDELSRAGLPSDRHLDEMRHPLLQPPSSGDGNAGNKVIELLSEFAFSLSIEKDFHGPEDRSLA
jgi:hypothetical protein